MWKITAKTIVKKRKDFYFNFKLFNSTSFNEAF